jgi:hypothetical protein
MCTRFSRGVLAMADSVDALMKGLVSLRTPAHLFAVKVKVNVHWKLPLDSAGQTRKCSLHKKRTPSTSLEKAGNSMVGRRWEDGIPMAYQIIDPHAAVEAVHRRLIYDAIYACVLHANFRGCHRSRLRF